MKKFLCVFCALMLMLSLVACGDDNNRETKYELNEDGLGYTLVSYGGKEGEEVVISATYQGKPVTAIGMSAFMELKIKSVVIPEGVISIGQYAFSGCQLMESVKLPSTLTELGMGAFNDCQKLDNVVVPEGVKELMPGVFAACHSLKNVQLPSALTAIGDQAFEWCYALEQITIPETVTSIGASAFTECNSLIEIRIPDGVAAVHLSAFQGCERLEKVYLGANAKFYNIGGIGAFHPSDNGVAWHNEAFAFCGSLKNIEVSPDNPNYCSIEGNLFSKDGTELIRYAIGKPETVYTVPDSVTKIAEGAFSACTEIEATALETINIPVSVTHIHQLVFSGCRNLKTVNFGGTMEQWDLAKEDTTAVTGGIVNENGEQTDYHMINGDYGDFVIKCTDGDISGKTLGESADDEGGINFGNGDFNFEFN